MTIRDKIIGILRRSQKFTGTDMVYVAKGGFWWIFGRLCVFLISLATMTAFAHWLPKEVYGGYRYILSIVTILSIFALPGMDTALIRAVARGFERMLFLCTKTKFKWALIGSGISLGISGWYFFHQNFILGISFLIAAVFLPFITTFNIFLAFWQGKKKFDVQSKYLILMNLLAALVLIPVIFLTNNLILIIFAFFLSQTFFKAIFFGLTVKEAKRKETEKETLSYGKHLTLMQSVAIFGNQIDKVIIWQFLGPVSVAIYSFAQLPILRLQDLIPIFPLALPKLSEKDIKKIKGALLKKFFKIFLVSVPLGAFLILISPLIYKILFPQYLESIPYFRVLSLTLILAPFSLLGASLVAEMKKRELYIIQFAPPFLQIILFLALIPFYQIWGIIFAILISHIFGSSLIFYFFKKI